MVSDLLSILGVGFMFYCAVLGMQGPDYGRSDAAAREVYRVSDGK